MFKFRLVGTDGSSVDPQSFESSVPAWREGDRMFIRPGVVYCVIRVDPRKGDEEAVLVVERE